MNAPDHHSHMGESLATKPEMAEPSRRSFLANGLLVSTCALGYGGLAAVAGRYLYPNIKHTENRVFFSRLEDFPKGQTRKWTTPTGAVVLVTRTGDSGKVEDFIALSDVCPHLGCKVHWKPVEQTFFCPCHNGVFDPSGKGIGGPPGDAGQSLARYHLTLENNLLFINVPDKGAF